MEYKGYVGEVEFDAEARIFHGEVINTRDVITFQGDTVAQLVKAFHGSVDDYLVFCAERGEQPDKPFSGEFLARIGTELHRQVSTAAALAGQSINAWVSEQLRQAVSKSGVSVKTKRAKTKQRT